ncbi:hypothetical protein DPMN_073964 [Dreissena polymorpha]|uniref:Uncharacterized protein n=1 Tax=Dreissena polymorpha TaxID=45954 RepID=A0A9D4BL48_DREPO|nr:hypothetical protein DPMN_073964 [Dreissena polymorpha]
MDYTTFSIEPFLRVLLIIACVLGFFIAKVLWSVIVNLRKDTNATGRLAVRQNRYLSNKIQNKVPANPRKAITKSVNASSRKLSVTDGIVSPKFPSKDEGRCKINKKQKSKPVVFDPNDLEQLNSNVEIHNSHPQVRERKRNLVHEKSKALDGIDSHRSDSTNVSADRFSDILATYVNSDLSSNDETRQSKNLGNLASSLSGEEGEELVLDLTTYGIPENSVEHLEVNDNDKNYVVQVAGTTGDHIPYHTNSVQNSYKRRWPLEQEHVDINGHIPDNGARTGSFNVEISRVKQFEHSDRRPANTNR